MEVKVDVAAGMVTGAGKSSARFVRDRHFIHSWL